MSLVDLDVNNMISQIQLIYMNSYKKLFTIHPERYVNVDDLMKDLYYSVYMWDSHAGVSMKNTYIDYTDYRINSHNNGYIYVTKNAKIDNVYRIYREFMSKEVKNITINITGISDGYSTASSLGLILSVILPFIETDYVVKAQYKDRTIGGMKEDDFYVIETNPPKCKFRIIPKTKMNEVSSPIKYEGASINIITSIDVGILLRSVLYKQANFTIYSYSDEIAENESQIGFAIRFLLGGYVMIGAGKHIYDGNQKVKTKSKPLNKKYYPMV